MCFHARTIEGPILNWPCEKNWPKTVVVIVPSTCSSVLLGGSRGDPDRGTEHEHFALSFSHEFTTQVVKWNEKKKNWSCEGCGNGGISKPRATLSLRTNAQVKLCLYKTFLAGNLTSQGPSSCMYPAFKYEPHLSAVSPINEKKVNLWRRAVIHIRWIEMNHNQYSSSLIYYWIEHMPYTGGWTYPSTAFKWELTSWNQILPPPGSVLQKLRKLIKRLYLTGNVAFADGV